MGLLYGYGKLLDQTFHYTLPAPMDDRLGGVKTKADLDNITPYKSLIVYVEDEKKNYQYAVNSSGIYEWQELDLSGSSGSSSGTTDLPAATALILVNLQAEVAKLRNSFLYGITSYQGTDTALSALVDGMTDIDDKEPLWAIEEDDQAISLLSDISLDTSAPALTVLSGTLDISSPGKVGITEAYWSDTDSALKNDECAKHLIYMATSGDNITLELQNTDATKTRLISLAGLLGSTSVALYHYLIIISRTVDEKGKQYLYLSIDNNVNGLNLARGYYNGLNLTTTQALLDDNYHINKIYFKNLNLTKLNFYTKYQDFSDEVISSAPKEQDYKYSAAHLVIREVENNEVLESIKAHLLTPELVWVKETSALKINTSSGIFIVGSSSVEKETESDMATIKESLLSLGIVSNSTTGNLSLSPVESITMVDTTGAKHKVTLNSEGELDIASSNSTSLTTLVSKATTQEYPTEIDGGSKFAFTADYTRGFTAKLLYANNSATSKNNADWGLNSDRLKIGAFYFNYGEASSSLKYGCSHAYVELENTSGTDIPLDGLILAFTKPTYNTDGVTVVLDTITLALTGTIKKYSTYLIRGKKYAEYDDCIIKVKTYDQEWLDLDETIVSTGNALMTAGTIGFLLYYNAGTIDLASTAFITKLSADSDWTGIGVTKDASTYLYKYDYRYVDSTGLNIGSTHKWFAATQYNTAPNSLSPNAIYKNTFELDPAKQAFQSLNVKDSSRIRNEKALDCMVVPLDTEYITFNKTFASYTKSKFTPKASFENKTVCTDKTLFDTEKPNMVTCSFGINIHTTRCFNWVSAGNHHEFVFIKNADGTWNRFESFGGNSNNNFNSEWSIRTSLNASEQVIYNRMTGIFPATNISYTGHKCIITYTDSISADSKVTFTYVVGRADNAGNPDPDHCSEEYTFTLYGTDYVPRVYHITDLQGFHWVEYQVWSVAAIELNKKILSDCNSEKIIPVLINTGDMTLNGTRINEWLDYYNAGLPLFKHLEQMNVVGNNDLCNKNESILGTGNDDGKINPYYFHLFYCYEQPNPEAFIVNGRYIPSTYYFGNSSYKYLMVNSEITMSTCYNVYKLGSSKTETINVYTGYEVHADTSTLNYSASNFTPLYNTLRAWLEADKSAKWLPCCHEMPFTVITGANLASGTKSISRSIDTGDKLVGSHLNLLSSKDIIGSYWFSRLLEYYKIPLCIGGHKHTYVCTFPLRENFSWVDGENTKSSMSEQYQMPVTLDTDMERSITWSYTDTIDSSPVVTNSSKLPFTNVSTAAVTLTTDLIYPIRYIGDANKALNTVTYLMLQASGYKVKSNKELPSSSQLFSKVVAGTNGTKALTSQLFPMYEIISVDSSNKFQALMIRLGNIFTIEYNGGTESFNLQTDNSNAVSIQQINAENVTATKVLANATEDSTGPLSSSLWTTDMSTDHYIYKE